MNEEVIDKLKEAIKACAEAAAKTGVTCVEALQFTQAALNATNAIIGLMSAERQLK
jgi:hypothetical protein